MRGNDNVKRIKLYCLGFPSPNTRYVTERELIRANEHFRLDKWDNTIGTKFIRSLQGKLSEGSIAVVGRRLHGYFNWELMQGYRKASNPIDPRILPKVRIMKSPEVLSEDEIQLLLKKIPKGQWTGIRDHAAISLMLICGFRISTVTDLNWSDLRQQNGDWYIHAKSKGNVYSSRKLRPDLAKVLLKYREKTLGI